MITNEQVMKLVELNKTSKVASDVLARFAVRERDRSSVVVSALVRSMEKEGFTYTRDEYREVLKALSDIGVGQLALTPHGLVRGLYHIKLSLRQIGEMALKTKSQEKSKIFSEKVAEIVSIGLRLKGKSVVLNLNDDVSPKDIANLIERLVG